jgi:hypothetical protein
MVRSLLPGLFAGLLVACGGGSPEASPVTDLHIDVGSLPGGGSLILLEGVRIEVDSGVSLEVPLRIQLQMTSADGKSMVRSHEGSEILIEGKALVVAGGRLTLGDVDHGPVAAGDEVRVAPEGVWVNGELRTGES